MGWGQAAAPSGQLAPASPEVAEVSADSEVEVDQLAEKLASQHDIPISVATQMADMLRANKKVIPAAPRKYTVVLQEFVNAHQAANKVLLDTRVALEVANRKIFTATDALEVAKKEALQLSQDLLSAKAEAQRTSDELDEHSANSKVATKTVQPETNKLSVLQQAADLISSSFGSRISLCSAENIASLAIPAMM